MSAMVSAKCRSEITFLARIPSVTPCLVFGWGRVNDFTATVAYTDQKAPPVPSITAALIVVTKTLVTLAILIGFQTRALALPMALYTLGTGLVGHHFWTMDGPARMAKANLFYTNVGVSGGFVLLHVTSPGEYLLDRWLSIKIT